MSYDINEGPLIRHARRVNAPYYQSKADEYFARGEELLCKANKADADAVQAELDGDIDDLIDLVTWSMAFRKYAKCWFDLACECQIRADPSLSIE